MEAKTGTVSSFTRLLRATELFGNTRIIPIIPYQSKLATQILSDERIVEILHQLKGDVQPLVRAQIIADNVVLLQRLRISARECNYQPLLKWLSAMRVEVEANIAINYGESITDQDEGWRIPNKIDCPRDAIDVSAMIEADDKEALEFFGYWCCRIPLYSQIPGDMDKYFCPDFDWIDPNHSIELNRYYVEPEVVLRMCKKYNAGIWVYNTYLLRLMKLGLITSGSPYHVELHQLFDSRCVSYVQDLIRRETIFKYIEDGLVVINPHPEKLPSKYLFNLEAKTFLKHPRAQPILNEHPDLKLFLQESGLHRRFLEESSV